MLTQERLRELMTYDPETGIFTYNVRRGKNGKLSRKGGKVAGVFDGSVGYIRITIDSERFWSHRLAWFWMTGGWPKAKIDHEDTNGQNNKWSNLRDATQAQNGMNRGVSRINKVGLKGVVFYAGKYCAYIGLNGETHYLGRFSCPAAAHFAYAIAADKMHGEFARAI